MGNDIFYASYGDWKAWEAAGFMQLAPWQRSYFTDELRGIPLAGCDVLEIGFGNGNFLRWAQEQGANLFGTEILPQAIERARKEVVTILPLDLRESIPEFSGRFAVIAAFDVMEHLDYERNKILLDHIAQLLSPGGIFIARFPNGQSPLGRVYQYGDMTHSCILSPNIMMQLIIGRPFEVVHLGNPAHVRANAMLRKIGSHARALGQKVVEAFLSKLYGFTVPLGPNTVMILRRKA